MFHVESCFALCSRVLFSILFSTVIISFGEERAGLCFFFFYYYIIYLFIYLTSDLFHFNIQIQLEQKMLLSLPLSLSLSVKTLFIVGLESSLHGLNG